MVNVYGLITKNSTTYKVSFRRCLVCKKKCPECESDDFEVITTPELVHYGKIVCAICGRFIEWARKPKNEGKRTHTTRCDIDLEKPCSMCGRYMYQLGNRETLTPHHITPLEEGGQDIPGNILLLCTACHRLFHWARTYLRDHFTGDKDNAIP